MWCQWINMWFFNGMVTAKDLYIYWWYTRWWQLKYFLFSSPKLGKMNQFDEHIFQMGWFNHQPVYSYPAKLTVSELLEHGRYCWILINQSSKAPPTGVCETLKKHHPKKWWIFYQNKKREILLALRIMGSQNWWFGDPRALFYRFKPLFFGGSNDS